MDARKRLRHSVIRMMVDASEAASQVDSALSDGHIDHQEACRIQADIQAAEHAIATLRAHVQEYNAQTNHNI